MENIYVNLSPGVMRLSLPSGAGFSLKHNHAVVGDYFARYATASLLIPLEGCPNRFKPEEIHDPLSTDRTRNHNALSVNTPEASKVSASELFRALQAQTQKAESSSSVVIQEASVVVTTSKSEAASTEAPTFEGESFASWRAKIAMASPESFAASLKLQQLKDLAKLFNVPNNDSLSTKIELALALHTTVTGTK